eukprot:3274929-Amphidinium_carterae.8
MPWGAVTAASVASSVPVVDLQSEASCGWSSVLANNNTSLEEDGGEAISSWAIVLADQSATSAAGQPSLAEESDEYESLGVAQFAAVPREGRPPKFLAELKASESVSGATGILAPAASPDNVIGCSVLASGSVTPSLNVISLVVPAQASTSLVSQHGHPPMPLASQALAACVTLAEENGGENIDVDIMKLHRMFVASGTSFHHAFKVLQAESMECRAATIDLRPASHQPHQSTTLTIPGVKEAMAMTVNTTAPNCKILHVKHQYCMLFKVAGLGFVKLMGDSPCHLSVLQKTTAKVMKQALANVSSTSVFNDELQLMWINMVPTCFVNKPFPLTGSQGGRVLFCHAIFTQHQELSQRPTMC